MKIGVVVFPGSNCDEDVFGVIARLPGAEAIRLWHKDEILEGFSTEDCIVLPGGFSYGDYLRCGAIARFSPLMRAVIPFAHAGGKVIGICNGFQILCEAGLLPGVLCRNANQRFICRNVFLTTESRESPITRDIAPGTTLKIPIAHAEGRYHADASTLAGLNANHQVLFRYCDASGRISEDANPNGSLENIAGICNANRNVAGMMPHPERAAHSLLGNTDGWKLFTSLLQG